MTEYFTKFNNINLILLYLFSVKMWQVIASEPSPPSELSLTNPNTDLHTHLSSLVLTWHAPSPTVSRFLATALNVALNHEKNVGK